MNQRPIQQIYSEYKIPSSLQMHMYRVAGVASIICRNFPGELETEEIVSACLLHDMGNIVKFDLNVAPALLQPQSRDYWFGVQKEFKEKYGNDENKATAMIMKELDASERMIDIVGSVGFKKTCERLKDDDFAKKICIYADGRVSPYGVLSLRKRIQEGRKRYLVSGRKLAKNEEDFKMFMECYIKIEEQIFTHLSLCPEDINDETVEKEVAKIKKFFLPT